MTLWGACIAGVRRLATLRARDRQMLDEQRAEAARAEAEVWAQIGEDWRRTRERLQAAVAEQEQVTAAFQERMEPSRFPDGAINWRGTRELLNAENATLVQRTLFVEPGNPLRCCARQELVVDGTASLTCSQCPTTFILTLGSTTFTISGTWDDGT
jgi:hypothetical protein